MSIHLAFNRARTIKACLFLFVLSTALTGVASAQQGMGGGRGNEGAVQTPFPFLVKLIKFPVARLSKKNFIEMGAVRSVLPKGFSGKVKQEQQVVLLSYGYKKGGIVRIFETPTVSGVNPDSFALEINSSGIFHNVSRGDFKVKTVQIKGVAVSVGSENPEALNLAFQELSGK
jgi:hypothetical protein